MGFWPFSRENPPKIYKNIGFPGRAPNANHCNFGSRGRAPNANHSKKKPRGRAPNANHSKKQKKKNTTEEFQRPRDAGHCPPEVTSSPLSISP